MKKKILYIEDNEQNLYLVRFLLEKEGYEFYSAKDGQEGIMLAEKIVPDLILLDIQLPVMDGLAVANTIKKTSFLETVPIIAVTSYAMTGDREKALDAGCTDYIEKPIDPINFLEQIKKHLIE